MLLLLLHVRATAIVAPNTIFIISPIGAFSLNNARSSFKTGMVSPVNADSSTFKLYDFTILASAGIYEPVSIIIRSPGTTSSLGIVCIIPSLFQFRQSARHSNRFRYYWKRCRNVSGDSGLTRHSSAGYYTHR